MFCFLLLQHLFYFLAHETTSLVIEYHSQLNAQFLQKKNLFFFVLQYVLTFALNLMNLCLIYDQWDYNLIKVSKIEDYLGLIDSSFDH